MNAKTARAARPAAVAVADLASVEAREHEVRSTPEGRAYLLCFDLFAIVPSDHCSGAELAEMRLALKRLVAAGLVVSEHINGMAGELTYQCWETYDSITREEAVTLYLSKNVKHGGRVARVRVAVGRGSGPRYTEQQLAEAATMRADGSSFKNIGISLGIKATGHLASVLKTRGLIER